MGYLLSKTDTTPTIVMTTTAKPTTAKPTTAKSTTAKPTTAKPTTAKPTTAKPTIERQEIQALRDRHSPLVGVRKRHFEDLRKNHVPRYLYRAWSSWSGGGSQISINSKTEIVPSGFMRGKNHDFYQMNEADILEMAKNHYNGRTERFLTEFSSWASSLHLVLYYAERLAKVKNWPDVHVAIMDREDLDRDCHVLVWHAPHLLECGYHEYLAHGRIRGRGYKAVPLQDLKKMGIESIFSEMSLGSLDPWGSKVRADMFGKPEKPINQKDLKTVKSLASLFGNLAVPVAVALLTLRPRPWVRHRQPLNEEMDFLLNGLGNPTIPSELLSEGWLTGTRMIETTRFPDVQQWIDLLYALVKYTNGRGARQRSRVKPNYAEN